MAISIVSNGSVAFANYAAVTAALGGTTIANDIAVAYGAMSSASFGRSITTPSGYTVGDGQTNSACVSNVYYKTAGAGESNPSLSPAGGASGDEVGGVGLILRGVNTSSIIHAHDQDGDDASPANGSVPTPGLTITNNNCLVMLFVMRGGAFASTTFGTFNPNGDGAWTQLVAGSVSATINLQMAIYYKLQTTAANVNAGSIPFTGAATAQARSAMVAFNAAAATGFGRLLSSQRNRMVL